MITFLLIAAAPLNIPDDLYNEFILDRKIHVVNQYKDDTDQTFYFNQSDIDALKQKVVQKEPHHYGPTDLFLYDALDRYPEFIRDKKVGVISSVAPWYEAVVLAYGGIPVSIHDEPLELFDSIICISKISAHGLGRYGDPLNPNGDIETMKNLKRLLKPGGVLFLAIPVGIDYLFWNAHRVYGKHRLPLLLDGWKTLNTFGGVSLEEVNHGYHQPVFVLAPERNNGYVSAQLQGQLGNQMFQIAAAIAYGLEHGCKPIFPQLHKTEYGCSINAQHIFHRLDSSDMPIDELYHEDQVTHYTIYSPIPFTENRHISLLGFFQTPNYFNKYSDYIRKLFGPNETITRTIMNKYGEILRSPTVALHIRTFIPDGRDPNLTIGERGWKYFKRAMSYFPNDHVFLVFSDNMNWVKKNFPKDLNRKSVFIEGNNYWIDFYLMSFCHHQILPPESTFSWWAAWMNLNPNKKVIAPSTWAGRTDAEIIPAEWIKINIDDL